MAKRSTAVKPAARRKPAAKSKASVAPKPARAASSSKLRKPSSRRRSGETTDFNAADALFKLIESPLVADLLAVGATAALAAIAETHYSRKTDGQGTSTKALKAAGKAAAVAMGRRLTTEFEEIRKASKPAKAPGSK